MFVLIPNLYPYDGPAGMTHYIFWFKDQNITMTHALDIFHSLHKFSEHNVIFCNVEENKSITDIPHYHIFTFL